MAEGRWADWQVRQIAENMAAKCPKRDWFDGEDENYFTSLKSWAHICARQLHTMELDERQLIIFIHHLGIEHVGVQTFDPQDTRLHSDFVPNEGDEVPWMHPDNAPPLDIKPK